MDIELLRKLVEEYIPFNKFLGIRVVSVGAARVELELPWRPEFVGDPLKPAVHGGVISALADVAGGMAIWNVLENPSQRVSTIDLRIDYLRPGRLETLVSEATVVRAGRSVGVTDMRVYHRSAPSEAVATGKGVYAVKTPRGAPPSKV